MNALQQISGETVLTPAYGKGYPSLLQMQLAWETGKDFKLSNGQYCSIRDIKYLKETSSRVVMTSDHFRYVVI